MGWQPLQEFTKGQALVELLCSYCKRPQQEQTAEGKKKSYLYNTDDLPSTKYPPFCQGACGCHAALHLCILHKSCLYDEPSQIWHITPGIIPFLSLRRWHGETQLGPTSLCIRRVVIFLGCSKEFIALVYPPPLQEVFIITGNLTAVSVMVCTAFGS